MNMINKFLLNSAVAVSLAALLPSCAMEDPFSDSGSEGKLTITTEINGDVRKTRAIGSDELASLREKCIVYISNSKGVIRKYKGLDNIPESITLRTGDYVAEAWSGDSVSASFDSKFYRGYQKFEMNEGQNSLTLRCNIANVLVSVDPASLNVNLSDLKVTFWHSRGQLEFTEENIPTAKGYFMMPNADKDLNYKVEGIKSDGSAYSKEGTIENVQRAHEYCMTISQDESPIVDGGAIIKLTIADIPLIEEVVEIFPAPAIRGVDFDLDRQVVSVDRNFSDTKIYVRAYNGLSSLIMNLSDNFSDLQSGVNLMEGSVQTQLASQGVNVEVRKSKDAAEDGADVDVDEVYVTFTKAFLDALPSSDVEYSVNFDATDGNHKSKEATLHIANSQAAVVNPDPVSTGDVPTDLMAISATRAMLTGYLVSTDAQDYGLMYRPVGTSEWSKAYPSTSESSNSRRKARAVKGLTRADRVEYSVTLTGLQPGTTYEYKAFCDDFEDGAVNNFTTESIYQIPNASFENWSTYKASVMLRGEVDVILPDASGDKETAFWCCGNEGAASANLVLTDKSTDMVHSGQYSARLASRSALGMIASGNIFVGKYVKTDGTNGVLEMGRAYNGSHPTKLRVYANYRPGDNVKVKNEVPESMDPVVAGGTDQGQIYVALVTEAQEIRTKAADRKLFDSEADYVVAYGQVTWKENFGPDGQLQMVEIPLVYNERAKTVRPQYLVITGCASKFGDYFNGSDSSVLYLDDFELVYE